MSTDLQYDFGIEGENYSFKDKLALFLYALYFILAPFYLWQSGLPQLADFIFVLLILFLVVTGKFSVSINTDNKNFILTGFLFVFYIFFVNLTWIMLLQTTDRFIMSSLFYLYNYKNNIIKITFYAVLLSIIIQIILYFIGGGFVGTRMVSSFNNPNQLGYFALMSASILIFASYKIQLKPKLLLLGIVFALILVFASLSKAAIISYIGLALFFLFSRNKNKKFKRNFTISVLLLVLIFSIAYNTTSVIKHNQLISSVQSRIAKIGHDSDDTIEGRYYHRIYAYPQYWLFGAGEGMYSRFNSRVELHSTLGNIQVSYGMIGTILFIILILLALKKDHYRSWYILFFIMMYGLTHNGIRNSLLWILLALISCNSSSIRNKKVSKHINREIKNEF